MTVVEVRGAPMTMSEIRFNTYHLSTPTMHELRDKLREVGVPEEHVHAVANALIWKAREVSKKVDSHYLTLEFSMRSMDEIGVITEVMFTIPVTERRWWFNKKLYVRAVPCSPRRYDRSGS